MNSGQHEIVPYRQVNDSLRLSIKAECGCSRLPVPFDTVGRPTDLDVSRAIVV